MSYGICGRRETDADEVGRGIERREARCYMRMGGADIRGEGGGEKVPLATLFPPLISCLPLRHTCLPRSASMTRGRSWLLRDPCPSFPSSPSPQLNTSPSSERASQNRIAMCRIDFRRVGMETESVLPIPSRPYVPFPAA